MFHCLNSASSTYPHQVDEAMDASSHTSARSFIGQNPVVNDVCHAATPSRQVSILTQTTLLDSVVIWGAYIIPQLTFHETNRNGGCPYGGKWRVNHFRWRSYGHRSAKLSSFPVLRRLVRLANRLHTRAEVCKRKGKTVSFARPFLICNNRRFDRLLQYYWVRNNWLCLNAGTSLNTSRLSISST